jgi:hypothetical protein
MPCFTRFSDIGLASCVPLLAQYAEEKPEILTLVLSKLQSASRLRLPPPVVNGILMPGLASGSSGLFKDSPGHCISNLTC